MSPEPDAQTPPGTVTATVAVAAASVSFIVASIFCYGLMRREIRHHPEPSVRHKNRIQRVSRTVVSNPMAVKNRRHFVRLDELVATAPASFVTTNLNNPTQQEYTPSITWSVSDITSDSASLRSSLSRTTSMLERIEEEGEETDNEYEDVDGEEGWSYTYPFGSPMSMSITHLYGLPSSPMQFLDAEHFDWVDLADEPVDFNELEGCRYVGDYDTERAIRVVTPVDLEEDATNRFLPVMLEVDDLQISLDDDEDEEPFQQLPSILGDPMEAMSPKVGTDEDSLPLDYLQDIRNNLEPPPNAVQMGEATRGKTDDDPSGFFLVESIGNGSSIVDASNCIDSFPKNSHDKEPSQDPIDDKALQQDAPSTAEIGSEENEPNESTTMGEGGKGADARNLPDSVDGGDKDSLGANGANAMDCPETPKGDRYADCLETFSTPLQYADNQETESAAVDVSIQDSNLQEGVSQVLEDASKKGATIVVE
jgi:hypothetical protein